MNARMPGQFVGAAEAFAAPRVLTGVWLLSRVGADVSGLVFQSVESSVAERTFIWSRQVLTWLLYVDRW